MSKLHQFVIGDKVTLSDETLLDNSTWFRGARGLVGFVTYVSLYEPEGTEQRVSVEWVGAKEDLSIFKYHNIWLKYLGSTTE